LTTAANVNETTLLVEMVDSIPPVKGRRGRPRKRPDKLHADKGYASRANRRALRRRGIAPRIARKGMESSQKLGRHRWVVERTISWLNRYRRLKVRYERRDDIHQAFVQLAADLICFSSLGKRFC
jgi:IS5 family transposase